jgi:hypothetical protein
MPNWIRIALEISGDKKQMTEFINTIGDGVDSEQIINFEKIIPPPSNLFRGNIGREEEEYCKRNNIPNWYEWNTANWGTKWNASYCELNFNQEGHMVLLFETAWALPVPILERIEEMVQQDFKKIQIYGEFIEESYAAAGTIFIDKDEAVVRGIQMDFNYDDEDGSGTVTATDEEGNEFKFKNL